VYLERGLKTMTDHKHDHSECRHLLGSLSDYVDGELDDALCREIEAHMEGCENCRVVVNTLAKTVELYATVPQADLPDEVRERLFKRLKLDDLLDKTEA
jgi:anti-sigma factor RsiW